MTKIFQVILLILTIASCGESKKEPEKSKYEIRWEKQEKLDTLNQNEAVNLSNKFNALTNTDSTIKFTYQIQEIVKNDKLISFSGHIKDIVRRDSNYVLKVYGTFGNQESFIEILASPQQFYELSKQLNSDPQSYFDEGCFIVKPTSIKSSSLLKIDSEVQTDYDAETVEQANDNASSELTYDYSVLLLIKGHLLDFYIYKKLLKDDE